MGKSLVIVESPAKAKTINKYLGKDFVVKSSVGHIRDLPKAGSGKVDAKQRAAEAARTKKMTPEAKADYKRLRSQKQLIKRMGIDPGNKWQAEYHLLPKKEDVIRMPLSPYAVTKYVNELYAHVFAKVYNFN